MASVTRAILCKRALNHLGVLSPNEEPTSEEQSLAEDCFDAILAELSVDDLDYGIDATAVPDWAQIILRNLIVVELSASFGVAVDPSIGIDALRRLRHQQARGAPGELNLPTTNGRSFI